MVLSTASHVIHFAARMVCSGTIDRDCAWRVERGTGLTTRFGSRFAADSGESSSSDRPRDPNSSASLPRRG